MTSKTEKPTPKRLREARERGDVPRSRDFSKLLLMLALVAFLSFGARYFVDQMQQLLSFDSVDLGNQSFVESSTYFLRKGARTLVLIVAPLLALLIPVAVFANVLQTGFLFAPEKVKLDFKHLNVVANAKNLFSVKTLVDLVFKMIYMTVASVLLYIVLWRHLPSMLQLSFGTPWNVVVFTGTVFRQLLLWFLAALVVLVCIDIFWQRYRHLRDLRMSKDEVMRDYKESEGNPEVKQRRRELHRESVEPGMLERAREASVVVANPTHYASAVFYERTQTPLPILLCKGKDLEALEIIGIARDAGVPIIHNVALARALYARVESGQCIPDELLGAVAEVIKIVERTRF